MSNKTTPCNCSDGHVYRYTITTRDGRKIRRRNGRPFRLPCPICNL